MATWGPTAETPLRVGRSDVGRALRRADVVRIITFTSAGLPDAKARSMAGRISSGSVTCSPWPPRASTTLS